MLETFSTVHPKITKALPLVFDSPHSGILLPNGFTCAATEHQLQSGWDAFVEQLWESSVHYGATLQYAHYSRMFIDLNRAFDDIDPALLNAPSALCKPTKYSERGMGLIRRYALPGVPMYAKPLSIDEVIERVHHYYLPYHRALALTLNTLHQKYGQVWHVDCHSMKSKGNEMNIDSGQARPDIILGDNDGQSGDPNFVDTAHASFTRLGYNVVRNNPYKGGYLVTHYGKPDQGRYSMQIEINRALYMDESTCQPNTEFASFQADVQRVTADLTHYIHNQLNTPSLL